MVTKFQPYALSILRLVSAYAFSLYGWQKALGMFGGVHGKVPPNMLLLLHVAGWMETIGGAVLFFGLFTRLVAFILCGEMAFAYFIAHAPTGHVLLPNLNGGELAVLYCFIFLFIATAGGGAWSLDHALGRSK